MKIRFTTTVDIDREDWDMNYGTADFTPAEFREDVQGYLLNVVQEQLRSVGVLK